MSKVFAREEIILLKSSEIILDYPELMDVILQHPDIQENEISSLSTEAQRIINNDYPRIINAAENEWHLIVNDPKYQPIEPKDSEDHKNCELCGNTQCGILYPITNYNHSIVYYVGSICIRRFLAESKHDINEAEKRRKEVILFSRLDRSFPGLYKRIFDQTFIGDDRDYLVVDPLYSESKECHSAIKALCRQHVSLDENQIKDVNIKIRNMVSQYDRYEQEIKEYLGKAASNHKIPDRRTVNLMLQRKQNKWLAKIRREHGLTAKTLIMIEEPLFLKRHYLPRVQIVVKACPIEIIDVKERDGKVGYIAKLQKNGNTVFIPHYDFTKEFGNNVMELRKTDMIKTVLSTCRVTAETDIYDFFKRSRDRLSFYDFIPIALHEERNELFLKHDNGYCRLPLIETLNNDMPFFISPKEHTPTNLLVHASNQDAILTSEEWKDLRRYLKKELIFL